MPKRILQGVVTSDKNAQTVTVSVERRFKHPLLQKTVRQSKKYRAHDEGETFKVGDNVRIQECAPKSKTKRWEVMTPEMVEAWETERKQAAKVQQEGDAQRHAEHEAAAH